MDYEKEMYLEEEEEILEENEPAEEAAEEQIETEEPVKTYTQEEFDAEMNKRLDEIVPRRVSRAEAKIRKEYEERMNPYKEAERVMNAGMGTDNVIDATEKMVEFYRGKGIDIPAHSEPEYSEADTKVLAAHEAQQIIELGYEEVVDEVDRLAKKGVANMTPREKEMFSVLANYRQQEGTRQELLSLGIKGEVIDSKEFKDFAGQFNPATPVKTIYELYSKTHASETVEKLGSMKGDKGHQEKTFYTPEEVDRLTEKDLENPTVMRRVRESMTSGKNGW